MAGYFYLEEDLPQLPQNLSYINYRPPTEIYSSDGEVIKTLGLRNTVRLDMISWKFQKAMERGEYVTVGVNAYSDESAGSPVETLSLDNEVEKSQVEPTCHHMLRTVK